MSKRDCMRLFKGRWDNGDFVCVGLDIVFEKLPVTAHRYAKGGKVSPTESMFEFGCNIVDTTCDVVAAYKLNSAFFEAHGWRGMEVLERLIAYINERAPDIPVILDAKRADVGNTSTAYATAAFDVLKADAITVSPYLGKEALQPFLGRKDKVVFVLCRISNVGSEQIQDLRMEQGGLLYEYVARSVAETWNDNHNCGLVVGATRPTELREVRAIAPSLPVLIPGVGAQGGELRASVQAGRDRNGRGFLVNSSREVLYASPHDDYAQAARDAVSRLRRNINQYRQ